MAWDVLFEWAEGLEGQTICTLVADDATLCLVAQPIRLGPKKGPKWQLFQIEGSEDNRKGPMGWFGLEHRGRELVEEFTKLDALFEFVIEAYLED